MIEQRRESSGIMTELLGMSIDALDYDGVTDEIFCGIANKRGGWIVTANLDILRRFACDTSAQELYASADIRVADGMPLIWASRVVGAPLPERVAGSTLVWRVAERAAEERRSIYLLGGDPGAAEAAADVLRTRYEGITICGCSSPRVSNPATAAEIDNIAETISAANPDIVYVALGSPKQEFVARELRARFPRLWIIGVGISLSFVAGYVRRAPKWVQDLGMEWVHRMIQDPKRLAHRYLVDDLPFAFRLFFHAARQRVRKAVK